MSKLKVADHTVIVFREGKAVNVEPGVAFAFTADEMKDVDRGRPKGESAFRDPINESVAEGDDDQAPAAKPADKAAPKAGAKTTSKSKAVTGGEGTQADNGEGAGTEGGEGDDL